MVGFSLIPQTRSFGPALNNARRCPEVDLKQEVEMNE
jgi:hypothetical protein